MLHALKDTLFDTLLAFPLLLLCYMLLSFLNHNTKAKRVDFKRLNKFGPIVASAVGLIPQCGFSAAAATLYNENAILGGTLIAVFFATSDEALPVLLTEPSAIVYILPLFLLKFVLGVVFGYVLNFTVFKKQPLTDKQQDINFNTCENEEHHKEHEHSEHHGKWHFLKHALEHALKTTLFIFITMLIINLISHELSHEFLQKLLLKGSLFSPFITALVGLIPGCSISVLITELLINGSITFSAAFAGLSAGAGFGYVTLFKRKEPKKAILIIILCYLISALSGFAFSLLGF